MWRTIVAECKRCGNEAGAGRVWCGSCCVTRSRRKKLRKLRDHFGGKCVICGYDKCYDALDFHHEDPLIKEKSITGMAHKSFEKLVEEAKKCILVCANCHREIHEDKSWDEVENVSVRLETRDKISKAQKTRYRQPLSEETKQKISDSQTKAWAARNRSPARSHKS